MTSSWAGCARILHWTPQHCCYGASGPSRPSAKTKTGSQAIGRCICHHRSPGSLSQFSYSQQILRYQVSFPPRPVKTTYGRVRPHKQPLVLGTVSPPPVPHNHSSNGRNPPRLATDQAPNLGTVHPLVSHKAMQEAVAHAAVPLPPRKKRAQAGDPADPPAGFILNERGGLVKVEEAERATVLRDPETGRNLECIVRRRIRSKQGREYLLLLAMDTPIEVLLADHSSQTYKEISDEDVVSLLPHATFALAKRKLHLVQSGFCLTVRGAVSYTEDDIIELDKGNGEADAAAEGVEICRFRLEGSEYLLYTPFEPVLFVAYRDGPQEELQLAVDHEFEDRAVHTLLQEERRFQEMVDEEEAFEDVLMKRKGSR